jgi:hypothetical protein
MRLIWAVLAGSCLATAAPAAVITDWDAGSGLKPDQVSPAWYFGGDQNATLSGGALNIVGRTYYEHGPETIPAIDTSMGVDVELSFRYVSGYTTLDSRDAITVFVTQGAGYGVGFYIGDDRLFLNNGNVSRGDTAYLDTHDFHTYRLVVGAADPLSSVASVQVYRDGVAALSGSTYYSIPANGTDMRFGFGGGSYYASGTSDWAFVRNTAAVPEPASWAMMLAGFGAVGGALRRRSARAGGVPGPDVNGPSAYQ